MITKRMLQAEISDIYCDLEALTETVVNLQEEVNKLKKKTKGEKKTGEEPKRRGRPRKGE